LIFSTVSQQGAMPGISCLELSVCC